MCVWCKVCRQVLECGGKRLGGAPRRFGFGSGSRSSRVLGVLAGRSQSAVAARSALPAHSKTLARIPCAGGGGNPPGFGVRREATQGAPRRFGFGVTRESSRVLGVRGGPKPKRRRRAKRSAGALQDAVAHIEVPVRLPDFASSFRPLSGRKHDYARGSD